MSTINELCLQIEDLNKKIEDEPRRKLKRKFEINDEIDKLKDEKRRSGLRGDPQSVQKYNAQIKKLEHELAGGFVYDYESEIKVLKHKISDIVVDYYKKGHNIDEIFKIENVPQNVQEEWLNKSNFGRRTGFLFVDEIGKDEEYNWKYINPILDIEYKSKILDNLEYQIKSHGEVYLIFNDNLVKYSRNKDFKLYNAKIDEYISDLKYSKDASDIFKSLKEYKDKISKTQINNLTETIILNPNACNFVKDFKYIVGEENDENYEKIINSRINNLNKCNPELYSCIIKDLKILANKFNKTQINTFYNTIKDKKYVYCCSDSILNILSKNDDNLYDNYNGKVIEMKIDVNLNKLTLKYPELNYSSARSILFDLDYYSNYFNTSQLVRLCNISITNNQVYNCIYCKSSLKSILSSNKDRIDSELYEEVFLKNHL